MEETKEIGYRGSALPVPDFRNHCDSGALSGADDFCEAVLVLEDELGDHLLLHIRIALVGEGPVVTAYELINKVCRGNLVPSVRGLIEECQEVSEDGVTRLTVKVVLNLLLGISFALVPAALWPSVPKIIDEKVLGSAYCLIFWVQNFGLCFVPLLIGSVLASSNADNPAVIAAKKAGAEFIPYDYTLPLIIFACFGVAALLLAMYLKLIDKKNGYGLEKPNIV